MVGFKKLLPAPSIRAIALRHSNYSAEFKYVKLSIFRADPLNKRGQGEHESSFKLSQKTAKQTSGAIFQVDKHSRKRRILCAK